MEQILESNRRAWDAAADRWFGKGALPQWGIFGIEDRHNEWIGAISGKSFVEIGCGSGHSIQYLIERGAEKVYGLDLSEQQIGYARQVNADAVSAGRVELFAAPMEEKLSIGPVDTAFSIFAVGWTIDPDNIFRNVNAYLKPGGRFVWSWEHPFFSHVRLNGERVVVSTSYFDESAHVLQEWTGKGEQVSLSIRKLSTWFRCLQNSGFEVVDFLEPEPVEILDKHRNAQKYYCVQKGSLVPATMIFVCRKIRAVGEAV